MADEPSSATTAVLSSMPPTFGSLVLPLGAVSFDGFFSEAKEGDRTQVGEVHVRREYHLDEAIVVSVHVDEPNPRRPGQRSIAVDVAAPRERRGACRVLLISSRPSSTISRSAAFSESRNGTTMRVQVAGSQR